MLRMYASGGVIGARQHSGTLRRHSSGKSDTHVTRTIVEIEPDVMPGLYILALLRWELGASTAD